MATYIHSLLLHTPFTHTHIHRKGESSDLHVIIFDELDSICKQRGSTRDGTGVHDSLVNQLLSKIDGVDSLNNILLIGMTNRKVGCVSHTHTHTHTHTQHTCKCVRDASVEKACVEKAFVEEGHGCEWGM